MKKLLKKALSLSLCACMLMSVATSTNAQDKTKIQDNSAEGWNFTETVVIEGKATTYTHYTLGDVRYTEFFSGGEKTVIAVDSNTNKIYINDKFLSTISTSTEQNEFSGLFSERYGWKEYDLKSGNVGQLFGTVEQIAGMIATATQNPVAYCVQVASGLLQIGASSIDYNKHYYYWDPVTTSRPVTATCTYFWCGGTLIGTIDNR